MTKTSSLLPAGLLAVVVAQLAQSLCAAPPDRDAAGSGPESGVAASDNSLGRGTVEGIVRYQPDPKRPWKFSRYYVQNGKDRFLAETAVALEGSTLAATAPPPRPSNRTMDQIDFQFVPETMAIRAGDLVRITNSDEALHNVMTSDGGKPFNVNVVKGKEFTHAFDRAGGLEDPIRLGCVFHGGMRAWIYVFDHPWFNVTERDGQFRFEGVPAGKHALTARHPAGKLLWSQRVEVKPNETLSVEILLSPDHLKVP